LTGNVLGRRATKRTTAPAMGKNTITHTAKSPLQNPSPLHRFPMPRVTRSPHAHAPASPAPGDRQRGSGSDQPTRPRPDPPLPRSSSEQEDCAPRPSHRRRPPGPPTRSGGSRRGRTRARTVGGTGGSPELVHNAHLLTLRGTSVRRQK